jgi:hypothetical protein
MTAVQGHQSKVKPTFSQHPMAAGQGMSNPGAAFGSSTNCVQSDRIICARSRPLWTRNSETDSPSRRSRNRADRVRRSRDHGRQDVDVSSRFDVVGVMVIVTGGASGVASGGSGSTRGPWLVTRGIEALWATTKRLVT